MTGNRTAGLVLQPRDLHVLSELDTMRVIDRDQARLVGPFTSITRANTRLLLLTNAGLLTRLAVGTTAGGHKYLYARTRTGATAVGDRYRPPIWNANSPIVAGQPLLEHQLRLNDLYLGLRFSSHADARLNLWRASGGKEVAPHLIPDSYVQLSNGVRRAFFVEIDLATEPMRTWLGKVEKYLAFARGGSFPQQFHHEQFGVLVVVPSERRLHSLRKTVRTRTNKLFWFTTFDNVRPGRIWSPVWWRPEGESPVSLFH